MANKKRESNVTPAQIIAARGNMSQRAAAALLGVSLRTWTNWESGTTSMRERDLAYLKREAQT